ncbi:integrase arm-type DNA-binding domain-containing protein [Lysobacter sp. KIS68-7]|uniref:tyrosine-type recombinase/integrase n=1 Tax=Lysobacter sp. KIS68-7 TaxID=2904252 RepID=UPI001E4C857E|nr:integrase arm-type DNA-binding domain-containing protein [Lysobacter sp. KIS68-7]UHQ19406.1 integrase arm-type DNA-binding domain-containing protein [Lysobacter sp. KIS68-7]
MASKLTDVRIRNAKPGAKPYKISGGHGLCVFIMPAGAKYFRLRYRYAGKEKMLSLGVYPEVSLKEAEAGAAQAHVLLRQGTNPSEDRREKKLLLRQAERHTFAFAASLWVEHNTPRWKPATLEKVRQYLDKDLLPSLGKRPLGNITPMELGAVLERIERRKALNVAKKTRQWLAAIYAFAIAKGLTASNPAIHLGSIALYQPEPKNHAHIGLEELPKFLKALETYDGSVLVKTCTWLGLWTANRPGITRTLKWSELDLDQGLWTIPKGREGMKRGYSHVTPLPTQAVEALRTLEPITGRYPYVFVGRNDWRKPLSDGAVTGLLKAIGYSGKQTAHGFRHLVSTALNEKGYDADWVERQLAHGDPDEIRGTYNKAVYLDQRRTMMQEWADYLEDALRSEVLQTVRKRSDASR